LYERKLKAAGNNCRLFFSFRNCYVVANVERLLIFHIPLQIFNKLIFKEGLTEKNIFLKPFEAA